LQKEKARMTTRSNTATLHANTYIREHHQHMSNVELGAAVGMSQHTVRRKMTELGLKRSANKANPPKKELSKPKPVAKTKTAKPNHLKAKPKPVKAKQPAKPKPVKPKQVNAVKAKTARSNASKMADVFIRESYIHMSNAELGASLGLSPHTVRRKMTELGLKRSANKANPPKQPVKPKPVTKAKRAKTARSNAPKKAASAADAFIRKSYKHMSNVELGVALGLSPHTVRRKMTELGLKRPKK